MLAVVVFSGCSSVEHMDYTAFKNAAPRSIFVPLPVTGSPKPESAVAVMASAVLPLAEAGYYVIPATLAYDILVRRGGKNAVELANLPLEEIKQNFGADAVLYLTVNKYDINYLVVDSIYTVSVTAELKDIATGATLWKQTAKNDNTSLPSTDWISLLVKGLIKQLSNHMLDPGVEISVENSYNMFIPDSSVMTNPFLSGPYSPNYRKDKVLNK